MAEKNNQQVAVAEIFDRDEVTDVLRSTFYSASAKGKPRRRKSKPAQEATEHYEVICISLYKEDLMRLDAKVEQLKLSGHRKMSRSALIRFALDYVDVSKLPRAY